MPFKSRLKIVDQLSIGSPCPDESFKNSAKEKDKGWYCNLCCKDVYDLKKMSKKEIAKLIKDTEGNFCAVISRRADGSMITKEPIGATNTFLSTGLLLASTTLVSSTAVAQIERGDVAPPPSNIESVRGEVYVAPETPKSSAASSEGSRYTHTSSEPSVSERPDSVVYEAAGGIRVPEMRGKVKVDPK